MNTAGFLKNRGRNMLKSVDGVDQALSTLVEAFHASN